MEPCSDAYIQQHTIGDASHNDTIYLSPYQKQWQQQYLEEAACIKKALQETALRIEHIGSTSVPGLCAKPILDILLVVKDSSQEETYLPALKTIGYPLRIREPAFEEHRMCRKTQPLCNLHIFSEGSVEIEKYLLFRAYLRTHEEARSQYARQKQLLAKKRWKYVQNYADAKSDVVQDILRKAYMEYQKGKILID